MAAAEQVRTRYTWGLKWEAVRQMKAGQTIGVVVKVLGIPEASLGTWARQEAKAALIGALRYDKGCTGLARADGDSASAR